jgi:SecD/SecF fusion protein
MKSIIYILLVAFLCGIVVSACPKSISNQKQVVTIQSVDERTNTNLLNESCSIIKNRLKDYGLKNFEISANPTQKTIDITFTDKVDVNEILQLTTSKGKIEFYETYNRLDVIKLLEKEDKLFSILNIPLENSEIDNSSAIFGYCKLQNKSQVDSYIAKHYVSKPDQGIKYLWSESTNKDGNYYLYLLKYKAAMDKSQILETVVVKSPDEAGNPDLMINFNKNGTLVWQSLSKSNIGKSIAIVLDNVVYSAPKVMGEINNGKCTLGINSIKEITRIKSLISNDELPLEFKLKE